MARGGGATKKRRRGRKPGKRNTHNHNHNPQIATTTPPQLQLSDVIPLLISTTSAAHSFLRRHDLHLLPSQSLSLESLLSSTSLSLSHLFSLFPSPLPPPNRPLPPQQNTFTHFLSSSPDQDPRWVHFFNLSKPSFTLLLRLLTPSLTSSLHPFSPATALAATLFRLAHGASFSAVARRFDVDSMTACRAFYAVCKGVLENLGHLFEFSSDLNRVMVGFGWISLPNCCGVLGVERFEVEGEEKSGCLLVQALVDSEGRFLDVSAGWPGVKRPVDVLKRSKLYSGVVETKECLSGPGLELSGGYLVPQYVLGGSCFPLLPWLLTPFGGREEELSAPEVEFNAVHRRGMGLVDEAFGRVKKRWKLVGKKWKERSVEAFPFVIVACCLLHNFLIKCSEEVPEENWESGRNGEFPEFEGEDDESGRRIRDALASHLSRDSLSS